MLKLIAALCFLSILPAQIHALTPDQVFDNVKDSIVVVKTLDSQGKVRDQGSGVLISSGRVATSCHSVKGSASYQVGRGKQFIRATLYAEDRDKDLCLLDAKGIKGKPAQLGKAASLKVGGPVYAVGVPQGLVPSLFEGIVAQLRGGLPPLIQITVAISSGSRGGGLFDAEGRLVGLTALSVEGGQSMSFAIPVEWVGEIKPGRKPVAKGISQIEWETHTFILMEMQDWHGLLDWCRKRTEISPENYSAWYNLGNAYHFLNRHDDASDAFRQALRINPEDANAWYNLGNAYSNLKHHNDAIEAYRQALLIDPDHASAWYNLGGNYALTDNQTAALDVVQRLRYLDQGKANKLVSLIDPIQTQHDQRRGDILDRYPIHRGELPGDYFERVIAKGEDPEKVKAFARRFGFELSERRRRLYSAPEPDMSGIPARLKEAGVSDDAIKTIMDGPQNWETRVSNVRDYNLAKTVLRSIPQKERAMTEQNVREWIPLADETTPRLLPLLEPRN
jgi:predicted TPR repeat methyltransferase